MSLSKEIVIPFNNWSRKKLKTHKRATSRSQVYGEVGDWFIVDGVKYEIKEVIKFPLWFIAEFLWYIEGAENKEEFIRVWKGIHYGRYGEHKQYYVHFFLPI